MFLTSIYDLAGNRTSLGVDEVVSQTLSYNAANQVVGWTYDEVGNILNGSTTAYTYDALNGMTTEGSTTNVYSRV